VGTIWDSLGLDGPTDDLRAIKKAYAKKLKTVRPDDDPEGFMALREALDMARNHVQFSQFSSYQEVVQTSHEHDHLEAMNVPKSGKDHVPEFDRKTLHEALVAATPDSDQNTTADELLEDAASLDPIEKVSNLLRQPFARSDISRWAEIFDDPYLDGIDEANDFEVRFLSLLLEKFGYFDEDISKHNLNRKTPLITQSVGRYIFTRLDWADPSNITFSRESEIGWLAKEFRINPSLNRPVIPNNSIPPEEYYALRDSDSPTWRWYLIVVSAAIITVVLAMITTAISGRY
jgi:hypothetical protein